MGGDWRDVVGGRRRWDGSTSDARKMLGSTPLAEVFDSLSDCRPGNGSHDSYIPLKMEVSWLTDI